MEESDNLFFFQRSEYIDPSSGNERIIDCEARIFCGGADECDDSFFHKWEEGILLRFIPSVDFIEEKDGLCI